MALMDILSQNDRQDGASAFALLFEKLFSLDPAEREHLNGLTASTGEVESHRKLIAKGRRPTGFSS